MCFSLQKWKFNSFLKVAQIQIPLILRVYGFSMEQRGGFSVTIAIRGFMVDVEEDF